MFTKYFKIKTSLIRSIFSFIWPIIVLFIMFYGFGTKWTMNTYSALADANRNIIVEMELCLKMKQPEQSNCFVSLKDTREIMTKHYEDKLKDVWWNKLKQ